MKAVLMIVATSKKRRSSLRERMNNLHSSDTITPLYIPLGAPNLSDSAEEDDFLAYWNRSQSAAQSQDVSALHEQALDSSSPESQPSFSGFAVPSEPSPIAEADAMSALHTAFSSTPPASKASLKLSFSPVDTESYELKIEDYIFTHGKTLLICASVLLGLFTLYYLLVCLGVF